MRGNDIKRAGGYRGDTKRDESTLLSFEQEGIKDDMK